MSRMNRIRLDGGDRSTDVALTFESTRHVVSGTRRAAGISVGRKAAPPSCSETRPATDVCETDGRFGGLSAAVDRRHPQMRGATARVMILRDHTLRSCTGARPKARPRAQLRYLLRRLSGKPRGQVVAIWVHRVLNPQSVDWVPKHSKHVAKTVLKRSAAVQAAALQSPAALAVTSSC